MTIRAIPPYRHKGAAVAALNAPAAAAASNDPYFASVVLLAVNNAGADGSTTFTDQSSSAKTITVVGNTQWDTASAPTGMSASGLFDGSGDWMHVPDSVDFTFGSGDFTIEISFRTASTGEAGAHLTSKWSPATGAGTFALRLLGTQLRFNYNFSAGFDNLAINSSTAIALNTWYHVAIVRSGTTITMYLDGVSVGSAAVSTNSLNDNAGKLYIGAAQNESTSDDWNGWLGPLRITKGVARYTANFTPPTLPYPTS